MRCRTGLVLGLVVLVAAGGVAGRWWLGHRAPYGPEVLDAQATVDLVDQATADAALSPETAWVAGDGAQILLGRVAWRRPAQPQPGGSLRIVVLDRRRHLMPGLLVATSARPGAVFAGSDGALDAGERRYPWLLGAGPRKVDGSYHDAGTALTVSSLDASPVTFQAVLPARRAGVPPSAEVATAPVAVGDLLIALLCVGPDGQLYWAQRLLH